MDPIKENQINLISVINALEAKMESIKSKTKNTLGDEESFEDCVEKAQMAVAEFEETILEFNKETIPKR